MEATPRLSVMQQAQAAPMQTRWVILPSFPETMQRVWVINPLSLEIMLSEWDTETQQVVLLVQPSDTATMQVATILMSLVAMEQPLAIQEP